MGPAQKLPWLMASAGSVKGGKCCTGVLASHTESQPVATGRHSPCAGFPNSHTLVKDLWASSYSIGLFWLSCSLAKIMRLKVAGSSPAHDQYNKNKPGYF